MNSEIILPLLIYLVLIAALSVFAVRKGARVASSLNISLAAAPWADLCWR